MRNIYIFLLAFILPSIGLSQNKLNGTVSDENLNPLAGALITLPEINKGVIADEHGYFEFRGLPNGKFKLQVKFMGYTTAIQNIEIPYQQNNLVIKMKEAVIETQEIVVSGASIGSQHENAVKIDIIKYKDLIFNTSPNFMESLTQLPGVDMISRGQGIAKPVIRGLSMNNILVLNNGVRLENYQYGENHPMGIDHNDLQRVEVIKGPASLLYGSDAVGGVLNFIKENPAPTGKFQGDYRSQYHSNTLGLNQSVGLKTATNKWFAAVRGGYKTHADYLQANNKFVPNTRFNEKTFNANSGFTGENGTFKLYYDYFAQQLGLTVPPVVNLVTERGRENQIWYQNLEHHMISSRNNLYLGEYKWEINVGYQKAMRKLQEIEADPMLEMHLSTLNYETRLHLPSQNNSDFILGVQGMLQTNRNQNNRKEQLLPDADVNNLGFIFLAQHRFFEKLEVQGGARIDYNQLKTYALGDMGTDHYHAPVQQEYTNINGSIGATYSVSPDFIFRANLAKAFRAPNISELTSNGAHGGRFERGNADLLPQNAYESDVSMHFHGHFLSFDLAGFYNRISNYIYLSPTTETSDEGFNIFEFSQNNAKLYGGEAGIHFHPKSLPWLHIKTTFASVTGIRDDGVYLPFIPANKLRYEIKFEKSEFAFLRHVQLKFSGLTASPQNHPSMDETKTVGYSVFNVSLGSEIQLRNEQMSWDISVSNLLDTEYVDHLSTLKELNYYNQGRNIAVSLRIPFSFEH